MKHRRRLAVLAAIALSGITAMSQAAAEPVLIERFVQLTKGSTWRHVATIPLQFATHHPQGMVKIGDRFYLSSVEITERTQRFAQPQGGLDRSAGKGIGHLFEFDATGTLRRDITLGEGDIYHPGGIDYDGRHIWVPVAEYRPDSRAIVYRVDPTTMMATEVFRYADHVGAIVHDTDDGTLHGASWGARRFYRWTLDGALRVTNADVAPASLRRLNPTHYIDYQDCHYAGAHHMLCSGLNKYRPAPGAAEFALGGLELVDLARGLVRHQIPVQLWTEDGVVMTQNPFAVEPSEAGLRFYFVPEDDKSRLFVYDVAAR
jgi:hypothetical protein